MRTGSAGSAGRRSPEGRVPKADGSLPPSGLRGGSPAGIAPPGDTTNREIERDGEIPAAKAIEEVTGCLRVLRHGGDAVVLAAAYALRGRAHAAGFEDHPSAFRDWRRALRLLSGIPSPPPTVLRRAGSVHFQMGLHSEGPTRVRHYNEALRLYEAAGHRQSVATVLVQRGLEWRDRGQLRRALRDLTRGLEIARTARPGGLRQIRGFIADVRARLTSPRA